MRRAVPVTITTMPQLEEMVEYYMEQDFFVFDVETVGKRRAHPKLNQVTWISFATVGRADVIPIGHPKGELIRPAWVEDVSFRDPAVVGKRGFALKQWKKVRHPDIFSDPPEQLRTFDVFPALKPLFFSEKRKVGHNVKFDILSIVKYYGQLPPPPYGDTIVLAHLLGERDLGLKKLVRKYFGHDYDQEDVAKPDSRGENGVEAHAFSKVARYALLDAVYTREIWYTAVAEVDDRGQWELAELEFDLIGPLLELEWTGFRLDTRALARLGQQLEAEREEIAARIFRESGYVWDLNSAPAKRKFLYETRGHEPFALTKGGADGKNPQPSTAAGVLEYFAGKDPVVKDLLEYAFVQKLLSTYSGVEKNGELSGGLLEHAVKSRIHTNLVSYGTATGRMSSRSPNLQNIPSRSSDPRAKVIRSVFVADPGHKLIVADYGQIEYRVLAFMSKEPSLLEAFAKGWDPHAAIYAQIYGIPVDEVTKSQRDMGKGANFAGLYGAGPKKFASMLGISDKQAKEFQASYEESTPVLQRWKKAFIKKARAHNSPYVETILGRRRYLPALNAVDDGSRFAAERQVVNTAVQGSAADISKVAMVDLYEELPPTATMLLQVHDELIVQAPEGIAEEVRETVIEVMAAVALTPGVELEVDAGIGDSWAEAK